MRTHPPRPGPPRWLRLPRRTARLRLTVLYGTAVFLACGATVLAVTYLFYGVVNGHTTQPVLHLDKQRVKAVPFAAGAPQSGAPQSQVTIHAAGLGQIALDKQQLLITSGLALAVIAGIAVAGTALGWYGGVEVGGVIVLVVLAKVF